MEFNVVYNMYKSVYSFGLWKASFFKQTQSLYWSNRIYTQRKKKKKKPRPDTVTKERPSHKNTGSEWNPWARELIRVVIVFNSFCARFAVSNLVTRKYIFQRTTLSMEKSDLLLLSNSHSYH